MSKAGDVEKRLVRVLMMLRLIQSEPRQWSGVRFAAHFEKSQRQIDEDIKLLRAAGYNIRSTPVPPWRNRGYEIRDPSENGDSSVSGP